MNADGRFGFAFLMQILDLRAVHVVIRHMEHGRPLAGPLAIEFRCDCGLRGLVAAMVTNKADCLETCRLEAARNTFKHLSEYPFGDAERAGKQHIVTRRVIVAFWHERHYRRHQSAPELPRYSVGIAANNV